MRAARWRVAALQTTAAAASHPGFVQAASHRAAVLMVAARTALRPRRGKTRACNAAREDGSADTPQPLNTCTVPHIQLSYMRALAHAITERLSGHVRLRARACTSTRARALRVQAIVPRAHRRPARPYIATTART